MGKPKTKSVGEDGYDHFYNHQIESEKIAKNVLRRLKFDNNTINKVTKLVRYHDERPSLTKKTVRRRISAIGEDAFPDLFSVNRADLAAQSMYRREEKLSYINEFEKTYNEIMEENSCLKISDLKITGKDIMNLGISEGPIIGSTLKSLLDEVLEDPAKNDAEYLVNRVREMHDI